MLERRRFRGARKELLMYKIVLMRHGRSRADDENKHEGRYDSPLTNIGKEQAKNTAAYLKTEYKFDKIISSPLIRAKETAQIIGKILAINVEENSLFMERDNGVLSGLTFNEAEEIYPEPEKTSIFRKYPLDSGENEVELGARALLCMNYLMRENPGNYLVVSHGSLLNCIIKRILNMPLQNKGGNVVFKLCDNGYIDFDYNEDKDLWIFRKMEEGYN
jgi:2,3-bisphosphoglycerate-dependent phosphoglycerate mutase